jgi:hypothetical protein
VGKPEGNRPLGRPRYRLVDNIDTDLRKIWDGIDWIDLVQDRDQWMALENTVMNLQVPSDVHKSMGNHTTGGLLGSARLLGLSYLAHPHKVL